MLQRGPFLLVTADDAIAESLSAPIRCYGLVRRAHTYSEAVGLLPTISQWCGIILDADGLELDALEALRGLRGVDPLVPVLALVSRAEPELVNSLHFYRAQFVLKPFGEPNVLSFVQRSLTSGWLPDERVSAWVDELARRNNLSPDEIELVAHALGNESSLKVQRRLGINETALKARVRSLLRKCNARSTDSLAKVVLRDALVFGLGHEIYEDEPFEESAELEVIA